MTTIPYGLRDVKVAPIDPITGEIGALVDLPHSQTFSFTESEEFQEMRGDDKVAAKRGSGPVVEWSLESGGISLEAYSIINGGEVITSGSGATLKKTYKKRANDSRPYFFVAGQAISESGGDFQAFVYKAIADGNVEGELADGEFWVSSASGTGIGDAEGNLYDFVENGTATPIALPV